MLRAWFLCLKAPEFGPILATDGHLELLQSLLMCESSHRFPVEFQNFITWGNREKQELRSCPIRDVFPALNPGLPARLPGVARCPELCEGQSLVQRSAWEALGSPWGALKP